MSKLSLKEKAIKLRKQGLSYSEILVRVNVSKATLSLWLRQINLSAFQTRQLAQKRLTGALKGAKIRREYRLNLSETIRTEAMAQVTNLDKKVFWLVGVALYWAEGSKQKVNNVSSPVIFSNSDPKMICLFYQWLVRICKIKPSQIYFELYIHENSSLEKVKLFWGQILNLPLSNFERIRFKRDAGKKYRKNTGENYNGLLRVRVRNSANLNRQIMGWAEGMSNFFLKEVNSGVV